MLDQANLERLVLSILRTRRGQATFAEVAKELGRHPSVTLDDWRIENNLEYRWSLQLRRVHQILKDNGDLVGTQDGVWEITPHGLNRLQGIGPWNRVLRVRRTLSAAVRDSRQVGHLKELYSHRCQVCGTQLQGRQSRFICEGHHIRPLGHPHYGPDIPANIIILCPNHHAQFDQGVLAINPKTLNVHEKFASEFAKPLELLFHQLDPEFLEYHWNEFASVDTR